MKLRYSQAYLTRRTFPFSMNWKFLHLWLKLMKEECSENLKSRKLSQKRSCFAYLFYRWENWFTESLSTSSVTQWDSQCWNQSSLLSPRQCFCYFVILSGGFKNIIVKPWTIEIPSFYLFIMLQPCLPNPRPYNQ